jgi:hypothetical protein
MGNSYVLQALVPLPLHDVAVKNVYKYNGGCEEL